MLAHAMLAGALTLWIMALYLGFNAKDITYSYSERRTLYFLALILTIAGVWIVVFIPS